MLIGNGISLCQPRGGGHRFVPTDLSGGTLWLPDDAGYITLNAATISQWSDRSGAGSHFTQGTAASQPTYLASPIASSFDGGNDSMGSAATNFGATAITVGLRFKLRSVPGASSFYGIINLLQSGGGGGVFDLLMMNFGGYTNVSALAHAAGTGTGTTAVGFSPTLDTNVHRLIITFNGAAGTANSTPGNYTMTWDGVTQTVIASAGQTPPVTQNALGARGGPNNYAPVDIYRVTAYNRALTAGEITQLDGYLS